MMISLVKEHSVMSFRLEPSGDEVSGITRMSYLLKPNHLEGLQTKTVMPAKMWCYTPKRSLNGETR